jgi:hypothetical protein
MSIRETLQKELRERLSALEARVASFRSRAGGRLETAHEAALAQWNAARAKLEELEKTTGDRWSTVKAQLEKLFQTLEAALARSARAAPGERQASTKVTQRGMAVAQPDDKKP